MKKIVLLLLCAAMIGLPLFAGGGGQSSGGGSSAANSLTVACLEGWYSAVSINDNLPTWQEIEKKTGIKINWQANSDYDTAMQPLVASGSKLPDIMLIPPSWSNSGVYKLGRDGMIRPLDDLIAKNAPNIQKLLQNNPQLKALITAPDGKLYTIVDTPMFVNDMVVQNALFLRKDWLDKLGLQVPVTIDDWHTVLVAFRDRDPNGNGKKDEIPWAGITGDGNLGSLAVFGPAFGLPSGETTWWYDNSGKVFHVPSSPQYRQFLQVMSQWHKEGLIDTELSRDEPNFQALVSTNVVGAFTHLSERTTQYNGLVKSGGVTTVNHILVAPPKSSDGSNPKIIKRDSIWNHYGITRDSKNPELAIRWMDYVWGSDEGVTIVEYGVEGLSFTRDAAGKPRFTDFVLKNPNGLDPYNALRSLGSSNTILSRTPAQAYIDLNAGSDAIPFGEKMLPYRVEPFPALMLSDADQAIVDRIQPDISTYTSETMVKFLIGESPLSSFNNYVQTLKSMNIDELLAVRQRVYDRSK